VPNNLQSTIDWCSAFIEYSPLRAGTNNEPAVTIASMIQNSIMNPPMTWAWNRFEDSSVSTQVGKQDYTIPLANFGFLEKASLTDSDGKIWEIKDIYNTMSLSKSVVQHRPSAVSIITYVPGTNVVIRFLGVPDKIYTINLTYQALSIQFVSFTVISVANTAGGNTAYTGIFTPASFEAGDVVIFAGFTNAANNGIFPFVSCTNTILVAGNPGGIAETAPASASAINGSWAPIPDQYSDVYNNLFLSEAFQAVHEDAEAARYRQRGVAALIAKAEGLTESQIDIFRQQWLSRDSEVQANALRTTQWSQARGV
jgi:hypothetical protein